MHQVSASCYQQFNRGHPTWVTEYSGDCGCRWIVDMWGNVRRIHVCHGCMEGRDELYDVDQLDLSLLAGPE